MDKIKTEWDLSLLLSSTEEKEIKKVRKDTEEKCNEFINKWKDRKDYLEDLNILKEALDDYEKLNANGGAYSKENLYYYYITSLHEDDTDLKAKYNKANEEYLKLSNALTFFELNLSQIPEKKQNEILASELFKPYAHFLKTLFKFSKHVLSEKEEIIMNEKSKLTYDNWVDMLQTFLSKEEGTITNEKGLKEKKNFSELFELLHYKNKKVRDSAAKAFNKILEKHKEVAEHELNAVIENKYINDKLRHYDNPEDSRLLGDDMEKDIVESLLKSVQEHNYLTHRFYKLKAKLLGQEKLGYHERNVSYGEFNKTYTFEESYELVEKVYKDLDPEFLSIFQKMFKNGQVDVFPKKSKHQGAYCSAPGKNELLWVLLNHAGDVNSIQTIAHEFGHAINFELSKKQNALNSQVPISTTEVASTFFEDFVITELLKNANDEERLSLMMSKLNDDASTIVRQIALYSFEKKLHAAIRTKGYLSYKEIGELFQVEMKAYMGDYVSYDKGSENWWIYWTHIRNYFYVYSYASGLLISKALQRKVKEDKKYITKVKQFLSAGCSKSPKEIFSDIGIDIAEKSFWDSGMQETEDLLNETEALAKKLGKI